MLWEEERRKRENRALYIFDRMPMAGNDVSVNDDREWRSVVEDYLPTHSILSIAQLEERGTVMYE